MAVYTKLNKSQIRKILMHYPSVPQNHNFSIKGIGMGTVNTYYKISFSNHQIYYLKIDEVCDESRLKNEIRVFENMARFKNQMSFEFPFPLQTQSQKFYIPFLNKFVLLFPEVQGKAIFKKLTTKHLFEIGRKMAELHSIPLKKNVKPHRFSLQGLKSAFKKISPALQKKHPELYSFIKQKLTQLHKNFPKNSPKGLIHADLFPENIHWNKNKLTGIIDFEAAGAGCLFFDICVGIHALCYKNHCFDLKKIKALLKGYHQNKKLSPKDLKNIIFFMEFTSLRFLITRLKDFELPGANPKAINFKDYREYVRRFDEISNLKISLLNLYQNVIA